MHGKSSILTLLSGACREYWAVLRCGLWTSLRPCTTSSSDPRRYSGRYLRFRSSTECWKAQFLGWSSTCPLVCIRQGFGQTVEKTVVPQLPSSDKVVDVPGVRVVQILRCRCRGDSRLPQLQLVQKIRRDSARALGQVVYMPVGAYNRCLVFGSRKPRTLRSCSSSTVVNVPVIPHRRLFSGWASDSVHRQSRGQTTCAIGHGTAWFMWR